MERGFGKKVKLKGPGRLKIERKQFLHVDEAYVAIKKQQQPILLRKEEREREGSYTQLNGTIYKTGQLKPYSG